MHKILDNVKWYSQVRESMSIYSKIDNQLIRSRKTETTSKDRLKEYLCCMKKIDKNELYNTFHNKHM